MRDEDMELRDRLVAVAREKLAADARFSLKALLADTGISRTQFRRCFADRKQLLAAVTGQDVQALGGILVAAEVVPASVQSARAVVGSDVTPAPPATDAWLERRLRVFERALAAMEKRQEKTELEVGQQIALLREQMETLEFSAVLQARPIEGAPAPAILHDTPQDTGSEQQQAEPQAQAPETPQEQAPDPDPAAQPVSAEEMAGFIAQARQAAQRAAQAAPPPRRHKLFSGPPRWLAWSMVSVLAILVGIEFLWIGSAMGRAAPPSAAITQARVPQSALDRLTALADSGDAQAQTLLALAYLKGQGVPADTGAARRWALAAARQGQPLGQYLAGALSMDSDASGAARWFAAAAAQGNIKAMHNLGIAYAEGLGVAKDASQAASWFGRAAQAGYRDSQFDLAVLYERGEGMPQDQDAALTWYLIAANAGDGPSAIRANDLEDQMPAARAARAQTRAQAFKSQTASAAANAAPRL